MQFVRPLPFAEALDKIGRKSPIGAKLSSSEWSDVPVQLRERAFFSSQVESVRFLQRSRDTLADFLQSSREVLPNGQVALKAGSRAEFIDQLRAFAIAEGMGPLDAEDAGGLKDITSERRLGLIFDVQTQQAEDFGYRKQGLAPDVLNEFPGQRFIRVKEVKDPRDYHVQFENQVYLKADVQAWIRINQDFGVAWGPWGWGCGHDVEDADRDETDQLGLTRPGEPVPAPPPENFNDNLQASTKGLDKDLIAKLQGAFGAKLLIRDEAIRWNVE